jgi:hypothetical protein
MQIAIGSRKGIGSIHGPTQEIATEWIGTNVEVKECQFVDSDTSQQQDDSNSGDGDPDDDEEDEDEEDSPQKKSKAPPLISLACSFIPLLNQKIQENYRHEHGQFSADDDLKELFLTYSGRASHNTWYTMNPDEFSLTLLCSGIQMRQP